MRTIRYPGLSKTCVSCGCVFTRKTDVTYLQWSAARFCSHACQRIGRIVRKASRHHNWKGGERRKCCAMCGASFAVKPYRADRARFCSLTCKIVAQDHGVSTHNEKLRHGERYRAWRQAVFVRDDFTCQDCGTRGGVLNADHIHPFALFPELRFNVENGRTLCRECHLQTPTFGRRMFSYKPADVVAVTKGF